MEGEFSNSNQSPSYVHWKASADEEMRNSQREKKMFIFPSSSFASRIFPTQSKVLEDYQFCFSTARSVRPFMSCFFRLCATSEIQMRREEIFTQIEAERRKFTTNFFFRHCRWKLFWNHHCRVFTFLNFFLVLQTFVRSKSYTAGFFFHFSLQRAPKV